MKSHRRANRLIHESSPYLLQHAFNPVDWHPWNEATLEKARSLDKMMLISIGYAACHWCHVMEKESFEDEGVADIMNKHFICVKVDREERPDIDQVYMNAIQLMTGGGGWPLNCFALPDGRPFFGGTYFRKSQWIQLLENIARLYYQSRKELGKQAEALTKGVIDSDVIIPLPEAPAITMSDLQDLTGRLEKRFDHEDGGMLGAPKFPMPVHFFYLLRYYHHTRDQKLFEFIRFTLRKMAFGGIYDQIGGGFARYSTDDEWKVPHFEKMLYDNAQLATIYAEAFLVSGEFSFRDIAKETLGFVSRELTSPEGAFFSSLDADSEGQEGEYYVWKVDEFSNVTGKYSEIFRRYYNVGGKGFWEEGKNILLTTRSPDEFARDQGLQPSQFFKILQATKKKLLKARQNRTRPSLDDKVITSWNALMMKAYIDGYRITGDQLYLGIALKNAQFITNNLLKANNSLFHTWKAGKASVNGFLEDYCFAADAFLELYQVNFDRKWLDLSLRLAEYAIDHFFDTQKGLFFFTSDEDPSLIARKKEIYDNVIPSSNSSMAGVLFRLGHIMERGDFLEKAEQMVSTIKPMMHEHSSAFSNWASVALNLAKEYCMIVIIGNDAFYKAKKLLDHFHPGRFVVASEGKSDLPLFKDRFVEGKTMIYVCSGKECKLPTTEVDEVLRFLC